MSHWQSAMSGQDYNSTTGTHSGPSTPDDDWSGITDPNERRKVQNRIAQRRFRDKARQQRRIDAQLEETARYTSAAYTTPDPQELDTSYISGPPWGSISLKFCFEAGYEKQRTSQAFVTSTPHTGGTTRPGLHLIEEYARGNPAWVSWRMPQGSGKPASSIDTDSFDDRAG